MERIVGAVSCKSELAGSLRILRINLHIGGGEGDQGLPFEAALAGPVAAYSSCNASLEISSTIPRRTRERTRSIASAVTGRP